MSEHTTCTYPYVDLHSHLQFDDFDDDRESILKEMKDKNIITILVGTTIETSLAGVSLASQHSDACYATVGLHPVYAHEHGEIELAQFTQHVSTHAQNPHVVGIGECGMDFFRTENAQSDTVYQEKVFEQQIQLAKKYNMPLMLHVRDSYQETLTILSKYFNATDVEYRGNAHFFVGSIEEAQAFLDLGFSISFTGVITFVPAYEALVRFVPLERMFVETDSPYVSPVPFRGKKNTPVHVIEIYKKIAEIKGVPIEVVRETLYKNACKFWLKNRNIDNSLS
jgi:TatD DNase family protein